MYRSKIRQSLLSGSGPGRTRGDLGHAVGGIEYSLLHGSRGSGSLKSQGGAHPLAVGMNPFLPYLAGTAGAGTGDLGGLLQSLLGGVQGGSPAGLLGQLTGGLMGGGFGIGTLLSGLFGLFGGGGASAPAPLLPFQLPAPVQYQGAIDGPGGASGVSPVSYSQSGQPRPGQTQQAQQVTVTVHAMDSQSFLDRSDDIARAVRQAMLHSSPLNDMVAELR